jgi:hypothetical protein
MNLSGWTQECSDRMVEPSIVSKRGCVPCEFCNAVLHQSNWVHALHRQNMGKTCGSDKRCLLCPYNTCSICKISHAGSGNNAIQTRGFNIVYRCHQGGVQLAGTDSGAGVDCLQSATSLYWSSQYIQEYMHHFLPILHAVRDDLGLNGHKRDFSEMLLVLSAWLSTAFWGVSLIHTFFRRRCNEFCGGQVCTS